MFGHRDAHPPYVGVVPISAVVSTPVVIPGAADRLQRDGGRGPRRTRGRNTVTAVLCVVRWPCSSAGIRDVMMATVVRQQTCNLGERGS